MSGPELKPCPFCGGEAHLFEDNSHSTAFDVGCWHQDCPVNPQAWGKTREKAIAAWNTRAALPEVQAIVAEAVAAEREACARAAHDAVTHPSAYACCAAIHKRGEGKP